MKKWITLIVLALFICLVGCEFPTTTKEEHHYDEGTIIKDATCTKTGIIEYTCLDCGKKKKEEIPLKDHDYEIVEVESTCGEVGYFARVCKNCDYFEKIQEKSPVDHVIRSKVEEPSIDGSVGTKRYYCSVCGKEFLSFPYVENGFSRFGKLHVAGRNLVDANNNVVQLLGISTHGLQWFGRYVNYETLYACKDAFNINVFRFSLYTAEDGYCESGSKRREELYQMVASGIRIASELDMYAIVDWHMLGADDPNDKNPLYYLDEAKEFFNRISKEFKDYDNVLYELMNEPNGSTTWSDCKEFAEEIIPIIRENNPDAICLIGNPSWSADLTGPMRSPLEFSNIMYTYHFYAADNMTIQNVIDGYNAGLPIFITEHGGMKSSGDGAINERNVNRWYEVLDSRHISYVAWNLSNSKGSSSILKQNITVMNSFADGYLKEWGIFYKKHIKQVLGITE